MKTLHIARWYFWNWEVKKPRVCPIIYFYNQTKSNRFLKENLLIRLNCLCQNEKERIVRSTA